jgi:MFS family permease
VGYLPILLLAPVAGLVADRVDKLRLIIVTQTVAMVLACAVGTLVWSGHATVPLVAVAAMLLGTVGAFDLPARQSFLVELVGTKDLPGAIAFNASVFNTARVVGPALAGVLVGVVGEAPCFFLNGLSYVAALWALLGMRFTGRVTVYPSREGRRSVRSGLAYLRGQPAQRALLVALGLVSAFSLQANVLMPSLAQRVFERGAGGYGVLLTAFGLGAVLSALSLATGRVGSSRRRTLTGGLIGFGVGLLGVASSPRFDVACVCQLVAGLGMIRFTATTNVWIQSLVDDAYRGRVMGLHTLMFAGVAPVGSLLLGAIAERMGPQVALVLSGTVPLLVCVWVTRRLRDVDG